MAAARARPGKCHRSLRGAQGRSRPRPWGARPGRGTEAAGIRFSTAGAAKPGFWIASEPPGRYDSRRQETMPALIHRRATPAHAHLLGAFNLQLIQDEGHRNPMTELQLAKRMRDWLRRRDYAGQVFEAGGEVVAYALYRELSDQIYLRHLFVVRHRRRQGIGREAMRILMSEVWPPGKRLVVEVLSANASAIAFWKATGYREYSLCLEIMPEPRPGVPPPRC